MGEDDIEIGETEIDFKKNLGIFLISLREKYKLPSIFISQIITEFLAMICHHLAYFSHTLNQYLENGHMHINEQECNRFRELLEEKSDVDNAFLSLDSEYKLNKFARLKLNYIKPIEYKTNPRKSETYQYVPILETLQNLLSHDDIFAHVINNHKSNDGILRDFCDGEVYERNALFSNNPTACTAGHVIF